MLRILTRLHVVPGEFDGKHLKKLCIFKQQLLVSMNNIVKSLVEGVDENCPVECLVQCFNSLDFQAFTGLEMNASVSIERQRFWTKPPRRLFRCEEKLLQTWKPLKPVRKINVLKDNRLFFMNGNESSICKHVDFGFSSSKKWVAFLNDCNLCCSDFELYFRREFTAKTTRTIVLFRTSLRPEFRDAIFQAAKHISHLRHVGLALFHVDAHDIATMKDPCARNFEFLERMHREDGRDALYEVYTQCVLQRPRLRVGDMQILRSLATRDGAQFLVHIRRMLFKMLTVVGVIHIDGFHDRVRFEVEDVVMNDIGISDYIFKTGEYLLRGRGKNLKYKKCMSRNLNRTKRKQVQDYLVNLIRSEVGTERAESNLFEHSDALAVIQKCRCIQKHYVFEHEAKAHNVALAPIPHGHGHIHVTSLTFQCFLNSLSGSKLEIKNIEDIFKSPVRKRLLKVVNKQLKGVLGHTIERSVVKEIGSEISTNGSRVSVRNFFLLSLFAPHTLFSRTHRSYTHL